VTARPGAQDGCTSKFRGRSGHIWGALAGRAALIHLHSRKKGTSRSSHHPHDLTPTTTFVACGVPGCVTPRESETTHETRPAPGGRHAGRGGGGKEARTGGQVKRWPPARTRSSAMQMRRRQRAWGRGARGRRILENFAMVWWCPTPILAMGFFFLLGG
jgi:hypothetical protein